MPWNRSRSVVVVSGLVGLLFLYGFLARRNDLFPFAPGREAPPEHDCHHETVQKNPHRSLRHGILAVASRGPRDLAVS